MLRHAPWWAVRVACLVVLCVMRAGGGWGVGAGRVGCGMFHLCVRSPRGCVPHTHHTTDHSQLCRMQGHPLLQIQIPILVSCVEAIVVDSYL
jgi:hypothetical protein